MQLSILDDLPLSQITLTKASSLVHAMIDLLVNTCQQSSIVLNEFSTVTTDLTCICSDNCSICAAAHSGISTSLLLSSSDSSEGNNPAVSRSLSFQEESENPTERHSVEINFQLQWSMGRIMVAQQLLHESDGRVEDVDGDNSHDHAFIIKEVSNQTAKWIEIEDFQRKLISAGSRNLSSFSDEPPRTLVEILEEVFSLREQRRPNSIYFTWHRLLAISGQVNDLIDSALIANMQLSVAQGMFDRLSFLRFGIQPRDISSMFCRSIESIKRFLEKSSDVSAVEPVSSSFAGVLTRRNVLFQAVRGSSVELQVLPNYTSKLMSGAEVGLLLTWTTTADRWRPFSWGPREVWTENKLTSDDLLGALLDLIDPAITTLRKIFGENNLLTAAAITCRGHVLQFFGRFSPYNEISFNVTDCRILAGKMHSLNTKVRFAFIVFTP